MFFVTSLKILASAGKSVKKRAKCAEHIVLALKSFGHCYISNWDHYRNREFYRKLHMTETLGLITDYLMKSFMVLEPTQIRGEPVYLLKLYPRKASRS